MKHVIPYSLIFILTGLFLIGACNADAAGENNLSNLALEEKDLSAGYVIDQEFSPILLDDTCTGDFCLIDGGSFSASKNAATGNLSIDQEIMVYSKPVTKDLLILAFNETYPELSTWNLAEQKAPEIGNVSIAFKYTVPEAIGPKNPPLTGYVIAFGTGDVYEIFKSTDGTYDDLKESAEVAATKLSSAFQNGQPLWKPMPK
jgi:hypothetical protein